MAWDAITREILDIAQTLIRIPSVSTLPNPRYDAVHEAGAWLRRYFEDHGLTVQWFDQGRTPAMWVTFPGQTNPPVAWLGHFDVVNPEPDDRQFEPRIEGDYLWGRGAADMKTVVATFAVWMAHRRAQGEPYPPIAALLVGNEEEGETFPVGTPHALAILREQGIEPQFYIAGERTEETGTKPWGGICTHSRGASRMRIEAHGTRDHTGIATGRDLVAMLVDAYLYAQDRAGMYFTLRDVQDDWVTQLRFPFMLVGDEGLYNITPSRGVLGIEVRSIPEDPMQDFVNDLATYAREMGLTFIPETITEGTAVDPTNPYYQALVAAVTEVRGEPPETCRKRPASSIRYAPKDRGVVWGQSGWGPHRADERHYIPSIRPYYDALQAYGQRLLAMTASH
ncbi:MAG: M20 family metallopeptidase [Chloroflexi bacterium]|nr:M20 family metallopeptidase [Chloroflexota bacterium]